MIFDQICNNATMKVARKILSIVLAAALAGLTVIACSQPFEAGSAVSTMSVVVSTARAATMAAGDPELPRVYLDTTYVTPTGRTIAVVAGGNLQTAINQAVPGDVITLQAGATFTGNYTLPAKSGTGWVTIRTSAPDASLPPPGTRVTPSYAPVMAKIISPNSNEAVVTASRAHHYRFIGLELGVAQGVDIYSIMSFDTEATKIEDVPHDFIVDRCYIHGNKTGNARRGLVINSGATAVIDSYIANFHEQEADSQAIAGWSGPGPFKIVNNYLEGSGENFLMGGSDPPITNLVPSDIEFRLNTVFKPLTWRLGDPSYAGVPIRVKNLFELKNAQRVLIDRNTFENNWSDGQDGMAILFTPRNQNGASPWSTVQDVTFTNNIVRHSGGLFNISGADSEAGPSLPAARVLIRNNLFEDIDGVKWGASDGEKADGEFLQLTGGPLNVTVEHNTVFQSGNIVTVEGETPGFIFRNNIVPHNLYGIVGTDHIPGNDTIETFFPGIVFAKNVMVDVVDAKYPSGNFLVGNFDQVGFVNRTTGNYRLLATSLYRNAGTDGQDVGCNIDVLLGTAALSNVSAASYRGTQMTPEMITAAFGSGLATSTQQATVTPLPTTLGNVTVKVRDRAGVERNSPLFFVSPTQINYLIPSGTTAGIATVTVLNSAGGTVAVGSLDITSVAPGLFTADTSGKGLPTGQVLRVKTGNVQQYESLARFDTTQNKWVAVPIDLGATTDQVSLVLYGTGIRFRSSLANVVAQVGGTTAAQVTFAGSQGSFVGLDQINVLLPRTLIGRGDVDVVLTVDGQVANTVRINIK